jgi:hypothetical protein
MNNEFFLTKVTKDWPESKLSVLKEILEQAEDAVLLRSDKIADPLFDTPNLPNYRGYIRWIIVSRMLEIAIQKNRLYGITSHWIPLGSGSVYAFEMRGQFTRVMPCHLLSKTLAPRESIYRRDSRIVNQVNPSLKGFEQLETVSTESDLLNILLVHGGRGEDFAYLRAYTSPIDRSIYRELSNNIMLLPTNVPTLDSESVSEPLVTLKDNVLSPNRVSSKEQSRGFIKDSSQSDAPKLPSDRIKNEQRIP